MSMFYGNGALGSPEGIDFHCYSRGRNVSGLEPQDVVRSIGYETRVSWRGRRFWFVSVQGGINKGCWDSPWGGGIIEILAFNLLEDVV